MQFKLIFTLLATASMGAVAQEHNQKNIKITDYLFSKFNTSQWCNGNASDSQCYSQFKLALLALGANAWFFARSSDGKEQAHWIDDLPRTKIESTLHLNLGTAQKVIDTVILISGKKAIREFDKQFGEAALAESEKAFAKYENEKQKQIVQLFNMHQQCAERKQKPKEIKSKEDPLFNLAAIARVADGGICDAFEKSGNDIKRFSDGFEKVIRNSKISDEHTQCTGWLSKENGTFKKNYRCRTDIPMDQFMERFLRTN